MEYELTHESLSAEREKMIREKKERAEKHDRPAAQRLAQVCVWGGGAAIGVVRLGSQAAHTCQQLSVIGLRGCCCCSTTSCQCEPHYNSPAAAAPLS